MDIRSFPPLPYTGVTQTALFQVIPDGAGNRVDVNGNGYPDYNEPYVVADVAGQDGWFQSGQRTLSMEQLARATASNPDATQLGTALKQTLLQDQQVGNGQSVEMTITNGQDAGIPKFEGTDFSGFNAVNTGNGQVFLMVGYHPKY